MSTAFQVNAFQNNAFQIDGGAVGQYPGPAGGIVGAGRRKHRRTLVEIDGEVYTVRSPDEAESLLAQAKASAEANSERVAKAALNKARDRQRKTGKLPTLEVAVPAIRVIGRPDPEIYALVLDAQRGVDEIYLRAAQAAELAWLARRAYYEQDEEDAIILLLH